MFAKNLQYYKFCAYGFLKNLRLFDIFLILYLREAGLSYLQIGSLYSVRQIAINIFEIPSGFMADIFGRKNVLLLSFLVYILSFLFFYIAEQYFFLLFSMFLFGIGEAFRSGTHKAMILDYVEHKNLSDYKTAYYGSTRSWSQFGSAISSLIAMSLVFYLESYRFIFLFSTIPYLLDIVIVASYPGYLNGERKQVAARSFFTNLYLDFKSLSKIIIEVYRKKAAFRATLSAATYIGFFKTIKDYLQPILESVAVSLPLVLAWSSEQKTAIVIGFVYFFVFVLTSLSSRFAWRVEKIFRNSSKSINLLYLCGIGGIFLSGLFLYADLKFLAVAAFILLYIVQNLRRPIAVAYLSEVIDSRIFASGLSLESQFQTLIVMISAPILGYLCDSLTVAGGLMVISLVFLLVYPLIRLKPDNS